MKGEKRKQALIAELRLCKGDFFYFCEKYLQVVAKSRDSSGSYLVKLVPNRAQREIIASLVRGDRAYVLKARKLGASTIVAAYFFWRCLFTPHFKVLVVAHKRVAAKEIFSIYSRFYANLPSFLKFKTQAASTEMLRFSHGGVVQCTTSSSDDARGGTPHALHLSEFAHYNDLNNTFASIMNSVPDSAMVVRETTANGLNLAHKLWLEKDGFEKVFIPWTWDIDYVSDDKPRSKFPPWFSQYCRDHNLSRGQRWWAYKNWKEKQGGNWDLFNQENPISPDVAFITSGGRFFQAHFAGYRITRDNVHSYLGYKEFVPPQKHRLYITGVDSANGDPNGDLSAFCTMDVTDPRKPAIVSSYYNWMPLRPFSEIVDEQVKRYGSLAVVETPAGTVITELLAERGRYLYRRVQHDKFKGRWTEKLGFNTNKSTRDLLLSRLHTVVENRSLTIPCSRLKAEINTFVFKKGKPQAESGDHDDMIFAAALALAGRSQVAQIERVVRTRRPDNLRDVLAFEMTTGKMFEEAVGEGYFVSEEADNPLIDAIGEIDSLQSRWDS